MVNVYIDCDGVILDTIERAFDIMKISNLDPKDENQRNEFFVNTDWELLLNSSDQINNSFEKIKYLNNKYNVSILTTCVNKKEPSIKKRYFRKHLPDIPVITVIGRETRKDDIVDPVNSILIDDCKRNIDNWNSKGGIGILFDKNRINGVDDLLYIEELILEINKQKVL